MGLHLWTIISEDDDRKTVIFLWAVFMLPLPVPGSFSRLVYSHCRTNTSFRSSQHIYAINQSSVLEGVMGAAHPLIFTLKHFHALWTCVSRSCGLEDLKFLILPSRFVFHKVLLWYVSNSVRIFLIIYVILGWNYSLWRGIFCLQFYTFCV